MGQESFTAALLAYLARLDAAAGEPDRADEHLAQAFEVVLRTGEDLHLPDLLRQRGLATLAALDDDRDDEGDGNRVLADLEEAMRTAKWQGARLCRLRAALDLARLPVAFRPETWRTVLADVRADVRAETPETADADALLAG
jgi:hypothetical protein